MPKAWLTWRINISKKGHKVYLEGRIKTRKWQDQSGADRYTTEIQANQMTMLTSRAESEGMSSDQSGGYSQQPQAAPSPAAPMPAAPAMNNSQEEDDLLLIVERNLKLWIRIPVVFFTAYFSMSHNRPQA